MGRLLKSISVVLLGAVLFTVVVVKTGPRTLGRAFSLLFDFQGLVLLLLTLVSVFFTVWRLKVIFKSFGDNLPAKELLLLWLADFGVSYLTPFTVFGGDVAKAYFTKKKFEFLSWERTISTAAVERIIDATVFFVFLIAGLAVFAVKGELSFCLSAGVLLMAGAMLGLLLFFYFKRWKKESAFQWLFEKAGLKKIKFFNGQNGDALLGAEKEMFQFFSCYKKHFWQVLGLSVLRYAMLLVRAGFLLFFLTGRVGFFKSLAVFGFANLGSLSPVPASLGTLDLSVGLAFGGLGLGFGAGTVFSMVWRSVDLLICFAGIWFFIKIGLNVAERKILGFFRRRP